jgi:hypothetical protein
MVDEVDPAKTSPAGGDPGSAGENAAPPLWFGLVFAGVGGFTLLLGIGNWDLPLVLFGLFFGSVGAALALTTITAGRGRRPFRRGERGRLVARAPGGAAASVEVFTRSPMRILVDLALAPFGGVLFLGGAFLFLGLGPMFWIGSLVFGFFGVFMLWGATITMRRGVRRAVAEVGPDGLWTPELPRRLAWSEIERLEVEAAVAPAGDSGLAVYGRLAIWPRDGGLAVAAPGRGAIGMARFFTRLVNSAAPGGLSDPSKMAPFGIQAYEIEQDFGELLRSVGRYAEVVGVTPEGEAPAEPVLVAAARPFTGVPGEILRNLGRQSGARLTRPNAATSRASTGIDAEPGLADRERPAGS